VGVPTKFSLAFILIEAGPPSPGQRLEHVINSHTTFCPTARLYSHNMAHGVQAVQIQTDQFVTAAMQKFPSVDPRYGSIILANDHAIFNQQVSPISRIIGLPFFMSYQPMETDDITMNRNSVAVFLMANPESGQWEPMMTAESCVGTVILAREDKAPLSIADAEMLCAFHEMLANHVKQSTDNIPNGYVSKVAFESFCTGFKKGKELTDLQDQRVTNTHRKVSELLINLTVENVDTTTHALVEIANNSKHESNTLSLRLVIRLLFTRGINEHNPAQYASLCRCMMEMIDPQVVDVLVVNRDGDFLKGPQLFRKFLLNRCQEEFERRWIVEAEQVGDAELALSERAHVDPKAKNLRLLRFIGEIFKQNMIIEKIMYGTYFCR
jgi:MIF4G domain